MHISKICTKKLEFGAYEPSLALSAKGKYEFIDYNSLQSLRTATL